MNHPPLITTTHHLRPFHVAAMSLPHRKLRSHRRAKLPPHPHISPAPLKHGRASIDDTHLIKLPREHTHINNNEDDDTQWSPDELDAISALFERPTRHNPPSSRHHLPLPCKASLPRTPTPKRHVRAASRYVLSSRLTFSDQTHKNPEVLIGIARDISVLPPESDAREVLDEWYGYLRKGSLSMTIRELGHMGLPDRALQTLCWAQNRRPELFPDDRSLASAVEVLARSGRLKMEFELEEYLNSASRNVVEAMARGFIRAGHLHRARKLLLLAKDSKRTLDASIYAKLILEAGKSPVGFRLASALLDELAEREELDLKTQDCTALMKVCIRLGRFDDVENLFRWYKETGRDPTIVMYTTVLYSRYRGSKHREGVALVWEMEGLDCLLDLPAYQVVIRLCIASDDIARAARYYSRLKEAGFTPTYDIYRDMIRVYAASGRLAKCRQICKEVDAAGLKLDKETAMLVSQRKGEGR